MKGNDWIEQCVHENVLLLDALTIVRNADRTEGKDVGRYATLDGDRAVTAREKRVVNMSTKAV